MRGTCLIVTQSDGEHSYHFAESEDVALDQARDALSRDGLTIVSYRHATLDEIDTFWRRVDAWLNGQTEEEQS